MKTTKNNFTYHIVKKAPVAAVVRLYRAGGWWDESPPPDAEKTISKMIEGSFGFLLVKDEEKNEIIGMGRVISDGSSDGYIQDLVVLNEYRGLGIGGKMVEKLVEFCLKKGLTWIGLIAEPGTMSFYEKYGFERMKSYDPMLLKQNR